MEIETQKSAPSVSCQIVWIMCQGTNMAWPKQMSGKKKWELYSPSVRWSEGCFGSSGRWAPAVCSATVSLAPLFEDLIWAQLCNARDNIRECVNMKQSNWQTRCPHLFAFSSWTLLWSASEMSLGVEVAWVNWKHEVVETENVILVSNMKYLLRCKEGSRRGSTIDLICLEIVGKWHWSGCWPHWQWWVCSGPWYQDGARSGVWQARWQRRRILCNNVHQSLLITDHHVSSLSLMIMMSAGWQVLVCGIDYECQLSWVSHCCSSSWPLSCGDLTPPTLHWGEESWARKLSWAGLCLHYKLQQTTHYHS